MSTLIDLTPARVDITVTQGDSLTFILAVKDSDGQPVTLTGTVLAQARRTFKDDTAVTFAVTTSGSEATLSPDGSTDSDDAGDVGVGLRLCHV
jgi:hypothetical protein